LKKILLVSSSKSFLVRNRNLLTREDFQLTTSQSGAEALQLHQEHHFDLIMADLHLHDMGGDTLCATLRTGEIAKNTRLTNMPGLSRAALTPRLSDLSSRSRS